MTPRSSAEKIRALVEIVRNVSARGWVLGTGGNFSVMLTKNPFRLGITQTGVDKCLLSPEHILHIDATGTVLEGTGHASAEAGLHITIVETTDAQAVFHTHSVWSTILSMSFADQRGLTIEGYEMLKGLRGVSTHEHKEWIPILENSQDIPSLSQTVRQLLAANPTCHGFLVKGHGLYTWGHDLAEAKRHTEILEFLLEVVARRNSYRGTPW